MESSGQFEKLRSEQLDFVLAIDMNLSGKLRLAFGIDVECYYAGLFRTFRFGNACVVSPELKKMRIIHTGRCFYIEEGEHVVYWAEKIELPGVFFFTVYDFMFDEPGEPEGEFLSFEHLFPHHICDFDF